jgi:hypothetical protein
VPIDNTAFSFFFYLSRVLIMHAVSRFFWCAGLVACLSGCGVMAVAGATAGAAISVAGAVVSTGVKVTGKVIEKTIDVVTPSGEAVTEAAK